MGWISFAFLDVALVFFIMAASEFGISLQSGKIVVGVFLTLSVLSLVVELMLERKDISSRPEVEREDSVLILKELNKERKAS